MDEFNEAVDLPLHSTLDTNTKPKLKKFIQSNHNKENQSFRSPWTNEYFPPLSSTSSDDDDNEEVGLRPSSSLRNLEIQANEIFESYTYLYYGKNDDVNDDGNEVVSSVYFWDKNSDSIGMANDMNKGFGGCFLIKKMIDIPNCQKGFWNSIHHVDVGPVVNGKSKYSLSTKILVFMDIFVDNSEKEMNGVNNSIIISGFLSKDIEKVHTVQNDTDHIANIGRMIEDVEIELRNSLDVLYIQKTREVIDSLRPADFVEGSWGQPRSRGGSGVTGRGLPGLMTGAIHGLPAATQNEMNAALMARLKKLNPS